MTDTPANPYRYYPPTLPRPGVISEAKILQLWDSKRDTYDIAMQTGIPEPQIEMLLHRALETRR